MGSDIARGKDTKSKCCKICLYESRGRIIRVRPQQFSTSTDRHVPWHVTRVTVHVAPGNHGDKPQPRCGAAQCEHWTSLPPRDHGCQLPLMQWQWPVPSTTATVTRPRSPAPSVQVGSPTLLFPPVTATLATPQPQLCSATPVQLQPWSCEGMQICDNTVLRAAQSLVSGEDLGHTTPSLSNKSYFDNMTGAWWWVVAGWWVAGGGGDIF